MLAVILVLPFQLGHFFRASCVLNQVGRAIGGVQLRCVTMPYQTLRGMFIVFAVKCILHVASSCAIPGALCHLTIARSNAAISAQSYTQKALRRDFIASK